ncbi:50S ribosomal protein L4 [Candidatus Woesearchaeota archaeon]|nr:50S ribosomal protein L4 [Candidatus Woesearchaeota archaeon]
MKATVYNVNGEKSKEVSLPKQFHEEVRKDIIKRAFLVIQSNKRQQYGSDTIAGIDFSGKLSRRRREYKGSYGRGISRVPRKVMLRRGTQFIYVGAVAPGTVGGRRAHPPQKDKIWSKEINKKERQKAIRSAIAASIDKESLKARKIDSSKTPIIIEKLESVNKLKDFNDIMSKLNLNLESKKKIRAGKGTLRGRKYKEKKSALVVVSKNDANVLKAVKNLPGVDVSVVNSLNVELLAPGAVPGRLIIWSLDAIEKLEKENLFYGTR